jgi:UDP-N-acetylglucosamine/UDP-N-acetylgalactosamine diphosphorylase
MKHRHASAKRTLEAHGQGHVLRFWGELDSRRRELLLDDVARVDLALLDELIEAHVRAPAPAPPPSDVAPAPFYGRAEGSTEARGPAGPYDPAEYRRAGERLLRAGRLAAFTVAGGQGTRLGWRGPKGTFPATPVTGKPLFRLFAEQIRAAERKHAATIPWYIMTSPSNDEETRAFFLDNNCFGLVRTNIFLFPQGQMPALEAGTGRILLAEKHRIAMSPDGHGGALRALAASGALLDMKARGVEQISYFQVDNPLARVADPHFLGLHVAAPDSSGEMSSKMVEKTDPAERVGVFVTVPAPDGAGSGRRTAVIEYTDLPDDLARARDADGRLRFRAGSIALHAISVAFVERLTAQRFALPYHRALKKVPYVDLEAGVRIEPAEPNAVKLETFIFDALAHARESIVYETSRAEEFAPIKNATGADSPATSVRLQSERAGRWLEARGVRVPRDESGRLAARLEIAPLTALEPADLAAVALPASIEAGAAVVL